MYKYLLITSSFLLSTLVNAAEPADRFDKRFSQPLIPKSQLAPILPQKKGTEPPPEAANIRFFLEKVEFSGSTIFTPKELQAIASPHLKKEITVFELFTKFRNVLDKKYGDAGYSFSFSRIPAQDINNGTVRIEIVETFIDKVVLEGDWSTKRSFYNDYVKKITSEKPISDTTLEKYVSLAKELPNQKVEAIFQSSKNTVGASTMTLKASSESKPFAFGFAIDNRGTEASGPVQRTLSATLFNPLGLYSTTSFLYADSTQNKELNYISLNHSQIINSEGTTLQIGASYSNSEPGTANLRAIEQESKSKSYSIGLRHPIIRSRTENLDIVGKFTSKNSESFSLGNKLSEDKIRALRFGAQYSYGTPNSVNQVLFEYSHGLKGLGATSNSSNLKSRADADFGFKSTTLNISRTQFFIDGKVRSPWSIQLGLTAQHAFNSLPSSEECGVGGQQYGRAYDSSELTGENCIAFSIEPRYDFTPQSTTFSKIQAYGFWDVGKVRKRNPSIGEPKYQSLASTGAGLRFTVKNKLHGSFELAKPISRNVANEGNRNLRVFANFRIQF